MSKIGVWPLRNKSNPRLSIIYKGISKEKTIILEDIKKYPLKAFFCKAIHIHWPDRILLRKRSSLFKILLLTIYLFSLKVFRVKIIQTFHNDPEVFYSNHPFLKLYNLLIANLIDAYICPSSIGPLNKKTKKKTIAFIPLGLYPKIVNKKEIKKKYKYAILGRLTRKKNIIGQLTSASNLIKKHKGKLCISGRPDDDAYEEEISLFLTNSGISYETNFRFLEEKEFDYLVCQSEMVLIDNEVITNSGVATKCITYGVKILTKDEILKESLLRDYQCEHIEFEGFYLITPPDFDSIKNLLITNRDDGSIIKKHIEIYESI